MARSPKPRPGPKGTKAPEALLVDDPVPLLQRCKRALEKALPDAGRMGFNRRDYARGEREYLLVSELHSRARARDDYPVLPLLTTEDATFWLAVAFRFGPFLGSYQLKHVSILIFEGLAADAGKTPLVRAEWDEADPAGPHAQPHWHVYPSALTKPEPLSFDDAADALADPDGAAEEPPGGRLEGERFHYAMAATWHLEENRHQCPLSEDKLLKWLPGCVLYTRSQLGYLSGG